MANNIKTDHVICLTLGCERRLIVLAWTQEERQLYTQPGAEPPHESEDSHSLLQDTEL